MLYVLQSIEKTKKDLARTLDRMFERLAAANIQINEARVAVSCDGFVFNNLNFTPNESGKTFVVRVDVTVQDHVGTPCWFTYRTDYYVPGRTEVESRIQFH